VDSGQIVKHDYVFTNTGSQLLAIREVRPSCGCTAAGVWDKQVEPGKTGKIPIEFNSAGFGGFVMKTVFVACNDPAQTNVMLQFKGTVWKPIEVTPAYATFTPGSDAVNNETKLIKIVTHLEEPVTLSEPVCTNNAFKAELKTLKEGKEFELLVTALVPFHSINRWTPIMLKTSTSRMPMITVNCYMNVQPAIAVIPSSIMLPAGPLTNAPKFTVTIKNNSTNSLVLSEPTMNIEGVDLQLKEIQAGRVCSVTVTFPKGFQSQPGQIIEATIKSNNPKIPLVKIPVFQMPGPSSSTLTTPTAAAAGQTASSASESHVALKAPVPVASQRASE
jgi:hypothetical protein